MSFSNVNYNLYKIFIAVYECKNTSRAAKQLFVGQPNVSRGIKELEKQLSVKLFNTNSRGVEPTSEGVELYYRIKPALVWMDYGEASIKNFTEKSVGVIRIVLATNFAGRILSAWIKNFNKKYPNIQFEIYAKNCDEALDMLEKCNVDLVFSHLTINVVKSAWEIEKVTLMQLPETFFASDEFAKQNGLSETVSKEKFEQLPWIMLSPQKMLKKPCGFASTQEMLYQLVMNNIGVGYCLEHFLNMCHKQDSIFKFNVDGIDLPNKTLDCAYSAMLISRPARRFLDELIAMKCD